MNGTFDTTTGLQNLDRVIDELRHINLGGKLKMYCGIIAYQRLLEYFNGVGIDTGADNNTYMYCGIPVEKIDGVDVNPDQIYIVEDRDYLNYETYRADYMVEPFHNNIDYGIPHIAYTNIDRYYRYPYPYQYTNSNMTYSTFEEEPEISEDSLMSILGYA